VSIFALHGTFFQSSTQPFLAHNSEVGDMAVALRKVELAHVFSGHFVLSEEEHRDYIGRGIISDDYGQATIFVSQLTDIDFHFWKKYLHREHSIKYEYHKDESGLWVGRFDSIQAGSGPTRCRLVEMSAKDFALE
jgi:hypothetical protein